MNPRGLNMDELIATILIVVIAWLIYLLPAVFLSLPLCILGRKRAGFRWWEASVFVLPFIVWLVCFELLSGSKSLGNMVEAFVLGCAVPLAVLIRVMFWNLNRTVVAMGAMGLVCAGAVLVAAVFPEVAFHWFH